MIDIIPAIDIMDGKCVRLTRGDYATKTIYDREPAEMAKRFQDAGMRRLHCVDLDGARAGRIVNADAVERICRETSLKVDFGGGIKSDADLLTAFSLGVVQVTAGSIAALEPQTVTRWIHHFGPEKIILGADFKYGKIAISGWQESTDLDLMIFLDDYISRGIRTVISTDISRDGMLEGSAEKVYETIRKRFPGIYLIASGGISSMEDIRRLDALGVSGVIVGKAFYEERITLNDIAEYIGSC
ncbi:MAG: 1-(5-phosphoribosyl)-5-[(5-phosphoribosylamino)methylideneamino]imidazole-4-carboxamide isomerase [Candidatus Marinimicrobia bacterium]|nr:1-(5-phosphoribosyl)-5-[(5-phosphoribosylamino)methylideneamino]imidazole-4-carboxamide isomerase [Candidatus Neomarinimicrobiota bacterium]